MLQSMKNDGGCFAAAINFCIEGLREIQGKYAEMDSLVDLDHEEITQLNTQVCVLVSYHHSA
jgi:hypothetical protein